MYRSQKEFDEAMKRLMDKGVYGKFGEGGTASNDTTLTVDMVTEMSDMLKQDRSKQIKDAFFKLYAPKIKDYDDLHVLVGTVIKVPDELLEMDWFHVSEHAPRNMVYVFSADMGHPTPKRVKS